MFAFRILFIQRRMMMLENVDWEKEVKLFFKQWFFGLINGLETQSEKIQSKIIKYCGSACAQPQATKFFHDSWKKSADLDDLLKFLNEKYCYKAFNQLTRSTIQVKVKKMLLLITRNWDCGFLSSSTMR